MSGTSESAYYRRGFRQASEVEKRPTTQRNPPKERHYDWRRKRVETKFNPPQDPFEYEETQNKIKAPFVWTETVASQGLQEKDLRTANAVALGNIKAKHTKDKADRDFGENFRRWLTKTDSVAQYPAEGSGYDSGQKTLGTRGRSYQLKDGTFRRIYNTVADKPLTQVPGVARYIDSFVKKQGEFKKKYLPLIAWGPQNENEAYLYYKYVVTPGFDAKNPHRMQEFLNDYDFYVTQQQATNAGAPAAHTIVPDKEADLQRERFPVRREFGGAASDQDESFFVPETDMPPTENEMPVSVNTQDIQELIMEEGPSEPPINIPGEQMIRFLDSETTGASEQTQSVTTEEPIDRLLHQIEEREKREQKGKEPEIREEEDLALIQQRQREETRQAGEQEERDESSRKVVTTGELYPLIEDEKMIKEERDESSMKVVTTGELYPLIEDEKMIKEEEEYLEEQQEGEEQSREKTTEEVLADLRRQQEEMRAIIRCMSRQSLEDVEREEEERKLPEFQEEMALISAAEEDPEYIFIGEQLEIISRIPSLRDAVLDDVRMWDSEAPLFTKDTPVQELRLTLVDLVNVAETEARKAEIESQLEETFGGSGPEETAALILKEFKDRGITKAGVGVDFSKEIAQEIRKNIPFKYRVGNVSKNKIQESDFGKYLFSQYRNDSAYIAAAREIISGIDSREELLKNMSLLLYLWPKSSAKAYRKTAAKHMLREIWTALENF